MSNHTKKVALVFILFLACCAFTVYSRIEWHTGKLAIHGFYLPMFLSLMWWQRKALFIFPLTFLFFISLYYFQIGDSDGLSSDAIRWIVFYSTSSVVAFLSERLFHLREKEKELLDVLKNSHLAVITTDVFGQIKEVNPFALDLYGYSMNDMRALHIYDLEFHQSQTVRKISKQILEKPTVMTFSSWHSRADNNKLYLSIAVSPVFDQKNNVKKIHWLLTDLTAQKAGEERILQSSKLSLVGGFASSIAHDLRNPLTVIIGFSKKIQEQVSYDEALCSHIERVIRASERIYKMIERLRSFVRKKDFSESQPVDLNAAIISALDFLSLRLEQYEIELINKISEAKYWVFGDPIDIENSIQNIIVNAIDAYKSNSKAGKKEIQISILQELHWWVLNIKDNAGGMPKEIEAKILEPFYTTKENGTGIGLMIVQKTVEKMGGQLRLENEQGQGVEFQLCFPMYHESGHVV